MKVQAPTTELAALGVPSDESGVPVITYVELVVRDADGAALAFGDSNTYDPAGERKILALAGGTSYLRLRLPAARDGLTFHLYGYDGPTGQFLAFGERHAVISTGTSEIHLPLGTLLGSAALTRFAGQESVRPDETLELLLDVRTIGGAHAVPLADFEVEYDLDADQGSLVEAPSKLGARIKVSSAPEHHEFVVTARVTGQLAAPAGTSDPDPDLGTLPGRPQSGTMVAEFRVPIVATGGVVIDTYPPSVTFTAPGDTTLGESVLLTGTASDIDSGLERVQLYQGTVLIGSSSVEEESSPVENVSFALDGITWSMTWAPPIEGTLPLRAVAFDLSGNQATADTVLYVGLGTAPPEPN